MGSVANEGDAAFWRHPGGKRVPEDEFPIYEVFFGIRTNDGMDNRGPTLNSLDGILNIALVVPAFFYVCVILQYIRSCERNASVRAHTLCVKTQLQAVPFWSVATRK